MSDSKIASACNALRIAAVKGNAEGLHAAAKDVEGRLIAPGHINNLTTAIALCRPKAAPAMAEFLRRPNVAEEIARQIYFPGNLRINMRIKAISALTLAGADPECMKHLMRNHGAPVRKHLSHLRCLEGSSHERLAVRASDPNLEDVLARPWNSSFHGSKHKDTVMQGMKQRYPGIGRNLTLSTYFTFVALLVSGFIMDATNPGIEMVSLGHLLACLGFGAVVFLINAALDSI